LVLSPSRCPWRFPREAPPPCISFPAASLETSDQPPALPADGRRRAFRPAPPPGPREFAPILSARTFSPGDFFQSRQKAGPPRGRLRGLSGCALSPVQEFCDHPFLERNHERNMESLCELVHVLREQYQHPESGPRGGRYGAF
jgi:hypothetical protein